MFGLVQAQICFMNQNQKNIWRHVNCGTCKTLGMQYGNLSRFILNTDVVFLAEILSALTGDINQIPSEFSTTSLKNCFSYKMDIQKIPLFIQFTSAINMLLWQMKLVDQIEDSRSILPRILKLIFNKKFNRCEKYLDHINYPLDQFWKWLQLQKQREISLSNNRQDLSNDEIIRQLAEPTATLTSLSFEHGAQIINQPEIKTQLSRIGYLFGELIYLLDAFEDYENDFKKETFNAVKVAFQLTESVLNESIKKLLFKKLTRLQKEISENINSLPISPSQKQLFIKRLEKSLSEKLFPTPRTSWIKYFLKNRWQQAKIKAQSAIVARFAKLPARNFIAFPIYIYFLLINLILPRDATAQNIIKAGSDSIDCTKIGGCCCTLLVFGMINRACETCCNQNTTE